MIEASSIPEKLRGFAKIIADGHPKQIDMNEIAAGLEKTTVAIALEEDEKKIEKLRIKKHQLEDAGKALYFEVFGFPLR